MKFSELVRLLESNGFSMVRQKGSVRYYGKAGVPRLIRVDYHGSREVPVGTCHTILRTAGIPKPGRPIAPYEHPIEDDIPPEEEAT